MSYSFELPFLDSKNVLAINPLSSEEAAQCACVSHSDPLRKSEEDA